MTPTSADPHWALFSAYCDATGRSALPATPLTIAAFFDACPGAPSTMRRRLTSIRGAHREAGLRLAVAPEPNPDANLWKSGPGYRTLSEALAACATRGWPDGYRGRRDAFLLVLASPLVGWNRDRIRRVNVHDIGLYPTLSVGSHLIAPSQGQGNECPACAVHRWVTVAALEDRWSAKSARQYLIEQPPPSIHVCGEPWPMRWWDTTCLLPAIDTHGWPTTWRAISTRSITAIVNRRLHRLLDAPTVSPDTLWESPQSVPTPWADATEDELWDALEQRIQAATAANTRAEAAIKAMEWPRHPPAT